MNRIYRLVWNAVTQSWKPVSETARARGKSRPARQGMFAAAALTVVASGLPLGQSAMAQTLQLCNGTTGRSYAYDNTAGAAAAVLDCTSPDSPAFSLQNQGAASGGGAGSTVFVRGMGDGSLRLGAQGGIVMLNPVNLSGNKIRNLAAGDVTAAST
ncbi:ESPR domain-containing protein, partial [Achromobacter xylosoxidans]